MTVEHRFALEIQFRALEHRVIADTLRIMREHPALNRRNQGGMLLDILDTEYPEGFRDWWEARIAALGI